MKSYALAVALALSLALMPGRAWGVTIFGGGAPDQSGNGNETAQWVQTEDFVLDQDASLTDFHFWTIEVQQAWDGTLDYFIFADNSGQPAASPLYSGAGQNIVKSYTGNVFGYDEYAYSFDLASPAALSGGVTYWFGLHLSANFDRDDIYWEATAAGFGSTGMESDGGTFDNWRNIGNNHAFFITGTFDGPTAVPEPVTAGLGMLSLGALALAIRRRRA